VSYPQVGGAFASTSLVECQAQPRKSQVGFNEVVEVLEFGRLLGGSGGVPTDGTWASLGLGQVMGQTRAPLLVEEEEREAQPIPQRKRIAMLATFMGKAHFEEVKKTEQKQMQTLQRNRTQTTEEEQMEWDQMPSSMEEALTRAQKLAAETEGRTHRTWTAHRSAPPQRSAISPVAREAPKSAGAFQEPPDLEAEPPGLTLPQPEPAAAKSEQILPEAEMLKEEQQEAEKVRQEPREEAPAVRVEDVPEDVPEVESVEEPHQEEDEEEEEEEEEEDKQELVEEPAAAKSEQILPEAEMLKEEQQEAEKVRQEPREEAPAVRVEDVPEDVPEVESVEEPHQEEEEEEEDEQELDEEPAAAKSEQTLPAAEMLKEEQQEAEKVRQEPREEAPAVRVEDVPEDVPEVQEPHQEKEEKGKQLDEELAAVKSEQILPEAEILKEEQQEAEKVRQEPREGAPAAQPLQKQREEAKERRRKEPSQPVRRVMLRKSPGPGAPEMRMTQAMGPKILLRAAPPPPPPRPAPAAPAAQATARPQEARKGGESEKSGPASWLALEGPGPVQGSEPSVRILQREPREGPEAPAGKPSAQEGAEAEDAPAPRRSWRARKPDAAPRAARPEEPARQVREEEPPRRVREVQEAWPSPERPAERQALRRHARGAWADWSEEAKSDAAWPVWPPSNGGLSKAPQSASDWLGPPEDPPPKPAPKPSPTPAKLPSAWASAAAPKKGASSAATSGERGPLPGRRC
ncbi:unnamed protein product, partial [Effrenium voratum]